MLDLHQSTSIPDGCAIYVPNLFVIPFSINNLQTIKSKFCQSCQLRLLNREDPLPSALRILLKKWYFFFYYHITFVRPSRYSTE